MDEDQRKATMQLWQAYNAMETTKQRHIDFLTLLENKKKRFNLDPTAQDSKLLEQLLQDHNEQVKIFSLESERLKSTDPSAHTAMFEYIGRINDILSGARNAH